ncbi:MAG: hypothetical protein J4F35_15575 [Candidatus Latescibacteria bacterium]|nr:hypothetical protein [Candidatus Latescibacterota bacterium]
MLALLNRLMTLLALCGAVEADPSIGDADPIEIELNPLEYVPLEAGNSWTYEHIYHNSLYPDIWEAVQSPHREIPLPPEEEDGFPPDSLRNAEKVVTIEVTHTEEIDGLEYFVFSDANYTWPPLPGFFWAGKKVRLSDEGILMFRWEGQDIPVYDFGGTSNPYEYVGTFPHGSGTDQSSVRRIYTPYRRSIVDFFIPYFIFDEEIRFLQGYGVGRAYISVWLDGFDGWPYLSYQNSLTPLSATISGREIIYEQVRSAYQAFESSGVGQVGQVRLHEGFDFSQGTHSESSNDFELVVFIGLAKPAHLILTSFPVLSSKTGVVDFGKIDFGLLISKCISPDLLLDFRNQVDLTEGHTYAVRSREGGIAFLYIFDEFVEGVTNIKFDWVYYSDGLPDTDTAVQPISWGQLKQLHQGTE